MNAKLRRKLARARRRIEQRLDKHATHEPCCGDDVGGGGIDDGPVFGRASIHYDIAGRTRGAAARNRRCCEWSSPRFARRS